MASADASEWIDAVIARHSAALTRPELLKSIRAVSARYIERRHELPDRSVLDSAGKRAAFAAFYAPLHFLTVREIARAVTQAPGAEAPGLHHLRVIDLGCGTGVAGAAWVVATGSTATIEGVDLHPWALGEARWNWNALGLRGKATRGDLVATMQTLLDSRRDQSRTLLFCGWSLNELTPVKRDRAIDLLLELRARGASTMVCEPIARKLVPWWDRFADRAQAAGGRTDEWRFPLDLPATLADLDEAAGFEREALTARSVTFAGSRKGS